MDAKLMIGKYGLKLAERNGEKGIITQWGKMTAQDAEYIKTHKAEIMSVLEAPKPQAEQPDEAMIAYRKVAEAKAKYHKAERDYDTQAMSETREAWEKALEEWQAQYPEATRKAEKIEAKNIWNL